MSGFEWCSHHQTKFERGTSCSLCSLGGGTVHSTNPKDRIGQKKVDLSLVPPSSLIYFALAMEDGANKYGPYNWRQHKVRTRVYIAAAMRHLQAYLDGEEDAADSKKPHLAHAIACLGILIDAKETGTLVDDRPSPGAASRLISKWEKKDNTEKEPK